MPGREHPIETNVRITTNPQESDDNHNIIMGLGMDENRDGSTKLQR